MAAKRWEVEQMMALGIVGSHRRDGNSFKIVKAALAAAADEIEQGLAAAANA